jgi:hypothetical protein
MVNKQMLLDDLKKIYEVISDLQEQMFVMGAKYEIECFYDRKKASEEDKELYEKFLEVENAVIKLSALIEKKLDELEE